MYRATDASSTDTVTPLDADEMAGAVGIEAAVGIAGAFGMEGAVGMETAVGIEGAVGMETAVGIAGAVGMETAVGIMPVEVGSACSAHAASSPATAIATRSHAVPRIVAGKWLGNRLFTAL